MSKHHLLGYSQEQIRDTLQKDLQQPRLQIRKHEHHAILLMVSSLFLMKNQLEAHMFF